MNNQTKPGAVSNDAGTATNVASTESVPAVADKPKTVTDQGDAGNEQTDSSSDLKKQITPGVTASVKLELSEKEADMIQTLLSDYVCAYRSDRSVDYKPELVPREKVGQYPWVATPPAPEIINPTYDWVNKKWYSKSNDDNLNDIAQTVADLKARSDQSDRTLKTMQETQNASVAQSLGVVKMMKQMSEDQSDMKKLMASMQGILLHLEGSKATQPEAPKADAQPTQPETKQENGGN